MSASPGRRQRRLRLSKRLIGKLCSGLRNILQSAEIRIDYGMNFWLERVATARRWCRLSYSNDSKGERGGEGVKGKHENFAGILPELGVVSKLLKINQAVRSLDRTG